MTDQEQIAALQAENARLREQLVVALAEVRDLQARLAKDSHNSSKPPSSDGLKHQLPRTRSLRRKTGKKPGGQLGHPGETVHLVAEPDAVIKHHPAACATCQALLEAGAAGAAEVVVHERRQVQDLPPIRLLGTTHKGHIAAKSSGVGRDIRIERRALFVPRGALFATVVIDMVIATTITHGAREGEPAPGQWRRQRHRFYAAIRAEPARADAAGGAGWLCPLVGRRHTLDEAVVATILAVVITIGTFWLMRVPVALLR